MMKRRGGRDAGVRVLVVATLVFVGAACSGADGSADSTSSVPSSTLSSETEATVATSAPADTGDSGEGEFSVLMLANIDDLTATSTLESLEAAGIAGFVLRGSAEEGFDLYRPGLTNQQALDLLAEILLAPGVNGGLIFETANLP